MDSQSGLENFWDDCFRDYIHVIHTLTGITVGENRKAMVQGRLKKRIADIGLCGYAEYLRHMQSNGEERTVFIDLITTNETSFFRTPRIWEFLEKQFLPEWNARGETRPFRAWSAAASSGEEAHSLAIVCQEFKLRHPTFQYQIVGTDISREMVSLCNAGVFGGRSIENFQKGRPTEFKKYMQEKDPGRFQVAGDLKAHLRFQTHNLFREARGFGSFDLILLRNVLIYFTKEDQERVLKAVAPQLHSEGRLIIGESETLSHIQTSFASVQPLIYRAGQAA